MAETVTVTQLNNRVKTLLKHGSVNDIWVSGEISGLKKNSSGHYYFTLKDEKSSISAVIFANSRFNMSFEPKEGDKVDAFGSVDVYAPSGRYQFIISAMRHSGVGDLYMRFEALKAKLKAEGLFDESRKRPIPKYPRRIGVVTSQTGAVIHDIITTSSSRFPADIYLAPAQVQGEGAAKTIVAGIELLDRFGVDVIIVGRGGGSLEDLWPFNEEPVARAIAACRTPVVSAVGHETDFTIADFVADLRAPTPTGAATLILRDRIETASDVESLMDRATSALMDRFWDLENRLNYQWAKLAPNHAMDDLYMKEMELDRLATGLETSMRTRLVDSRTRLEMTLQRLSPRRADEMIERLGFQLSEIGRRTDGALSTVSERAQARFDNLASRVDPRHLESRFEIGRSNVDSCFSKVGSLVSSNISECGHKVDAVGSRPEAAVKTTLEMKTYKLEGLSRNLESVSPLNVLNRGYGLITAEDGTVITSAASMDVGMRINVRMRDGAVEARIDKKEEKE